VEARLNRDGTGVGPAGDAGGGSSIVGRRPADRYDRPVRFLLHGNLNPAVKAAIERHGHSATTPAEAEIAPDLSPAELMQAAHAKQLDLVSDDKELATFARSTSLKFARSFIYVQLTGDDVDQDDAIDRLFERYKAPKPHQMYTVTETRVKVQQLKSA
jgi:hypothetical protein